MSRMVIGVLSGVLLCMAVPLFGGTEFLLTVKNPSAFARKSETIEVRLSELGVSDRQAESRGFGVVDEMKGTELVSQVTGELLLFQSDFGPGETKRFRVIPGKEGRAPVASMVDGYFARPREDYAWENDRIAFRMYGPALAAEVNNGIDVWTKRVRSLIVRKWYAEDEKEGKGNYYHTDRGEGADFFAVGKTLGAGGSGIWYHDSLYQPGVFTSYRTVANGPVRTSFELTYASWNVGGKKLTEMKRISLDAGQNLNKVEVIFSGLDPKDSLLIACGLVKRKGVALDADQPAGMLALWGPTNDDPANGSLGTGILLIPSTVVGKLDDTVQVLLLGRLASRAPFTYWAGAGWSRSGDFTDAKSWDSYLRTFLSTLVEPLHVSIVSSRR